MKNERKNESIWKNEGNEVNERNVLELDRKIKKVRRNLKDKVKNQSIKEEHKEIIKFNKVKEDIKEKFMIIMKDLEREKNRKKRMGKTERKKFIR